MEVISLIEALYVTSKEGNCMEKCATAIKTTLVLKYHLSYIVRGSLAWITIAG